MGMRVPLCAGGLHQEATCVFGDCSSVTADACHPRLSASRGRRPLQTRSAMCFFSFWIGHLTQHLLQEQQMELLVYFHDSWLFSDSLAEFLFPLWSAGGFPWAVIFVEWDIFLMPIYKVLPSIATYCWSHLFTGTIWFFSKGVAFGFLNTYHLNKTEQKMIFVSLSCLMAFFRWSICYFEK